MLTSRFQTTRAQLFRAVLFCQADLEWNLYLSNTQRKSHNRGEGRIQTGNLRETATEHSQDNVRIMSGRMAVGWWWWWRWWWWRWRWCLYKVVPDLGITLVLTIAPLTFSVAGMAQTELWSCRRGFPIRKPASSTIVLAKKGTTLQTWHIFWFLSFWFLG